MNNLYSILLPERELNALKAHLIGHGAYEDRPTVRAVIDKLYAARPIAGQLPCDNGLKIEAQND